MKDLLTPRELAELCGVSPDTVRSWCFRKQIKFASTPGGHKRFRRHDVLEFLKERGFPLPPTDKISPIKVLVIDDEDSFRKSLVGALQKEPAFNVKEAGDGYEAGRMIGEFEGTQTKESLQRDLERSGCRLLVIGKTVAATMEFSVLLPVVFPVSTKYKRQEENISPLAAVFP